MLDTVKHGSGNFIRPERDLDVTQAGHFIATGADRKGGGLPKGLGMPQSLPSVNGLSRPSSPKPDADKLFAEGADGKTHSALLPGYTEQPTSQPTPSYTEEPAVDEKTLAREPVSLPKSDFMNLGNLANKVLDHLFNSNIGLSKEKFQALPSEQQSKLLAGAFSAVSATGQITAADRLYDAHKLVETYTDRQEAEKLSSLMEARIFTAIDFWDTQKRKGQERMQGRQDQVENQVMQNLTNHYNVVLQQDIAIMKETEKMFSKSTSALQDMLRNIGR